MPLNVVILGAGISGLTAAWSLKKKYGSNVIITILEKSLRAGGWIRTVEEKGFLFEQGPRSCRSSGTGVATLQLIEELGLQDQVILAHRDAHTRYLYLNKKLRKLPWCLSFLGKHLFSAIWRDWNEPQKIQDESIRDFITRRGHRSFADYIFDPLTSGIYAGDISKLSIRSCFPSIWQWEQRQGSLIRGAWHQRKNSIHSSAFINQMQKSALFSLKGGMETIIRALVQQLEVEICYNCNVHSVSDSIEGVTLLLSDGKSIQADYVISTLPSNDLHYTSVVVVNLGYNKPVLDKRGFGYLIPSNQNEEILGCVWDSSIFPEQNRQDQTRLTVMMGGEHHSELVQLNSAAIEQKAMEAVQNHLGITSFPDALSIKVAKSAIPQYIVGHQDWVSRMQSKQGDNFLWLGTAFNGVSVNDCIYHASNL